MVEKEFNDQLDEVLEKAKPKTIIEELREKKSGKNDVKKALTSAGYNDEKYKESDYIKLNQKEKDYISSNLPKDLSDDWLRSGGVTKDGKIVLISADGKKGTKIGMIDCQLENLRLEDWKKEDLPELELPKAGKLDSEFAKEVGEIFKKKEIFFYRQDSEEIVEVGKVKGRGKDGMEVKFDGFKAITPNRFITSCEKHFTPIVENPVLVGGEIERFERKKKSMSKEKSSTLLQSSQLQELLPNISKIINFPMAMLINGKLTFPEKGFDKRFNSFLPYHCPEISKPDMTIEEAKNIIDNSIFGDFCWKKNPENKTNAIAGLITPALRGLYKSFYSRTPVIIYLANRERAGKDYCAGITGLVYNGVALEDAPINKNDEELDKRITGTFLSGRRRIHFSNCKGYLNSAVLEHIATASAHACRILGMNKDVSFDNDLDLSLSGNFDIKFTPDLSNRSIFVNLHLADEDANARKFVNADLHNWVLENRSLILSAIHCLIKNWIDKGSPDGSLPFASFPEWARVCGGIMESAGYGNPCKKNIDELLIGGDVQTNDMNRLAELCFNRKPNEEIKMGEIRDIAKDEGDLYTHLDLEKNIDRQKFSRLIRGFNDRVFGGIRFKIKDEKIRGDRAEYLFFKE